PLQEAQEQVMVRDEWIGELNQRTKDGKAAVVESRWTLLRDNAGRPQAKLIINTDVTVRKQLQEQLRQSQKMEAIGQLAGGVANKTRMLRRILGEDISLSVQYTPMLPSVYADPGMVEQALLNLVVNSRDAMPRGGQLLINTGTVDIDAASLQENPDAKAGQAIFLSVRDTGCGIAPENLSHIFEPFFTTKDVGKGTGLGLATVYAVVKQHGGWIRVHSEVGYGTSFR